MLSHSSNKLMKMNSDSIGTNLGNLIKCCLYKLWAMFDARTFGRVSKYDSGTSISPKAMLLMAIAAFNIWFVLSRKWSSCFLEFSVRPRGGTRGTGSHHFSSCRCNVLRKEADPSASGLIIPWSTYQNSVLLKLSNISCHSINQRVNLKWLLSLRITEYELSKLNLTISILSSVCRAGRLMKRSDLCLQAIT